MRWLDFSASEKRATENVDWKPLLLEMTSLPIASISIRGDLDPGMLQNAANSVERELFSQMLAYNGSSPGFYSVSSWINIIK